jgi:hypothetical protein
MHNTTPGQPRLIKTFFLRLLIAIAAVPFECVAIARASCTSELKVHLSMAIDAYKEWETYSNESTDTSDDLAKAEWKNFEHELHWINDHGDMPDCDDKTIEILYYLYNARAERFDIIDANSSDRSVKRVFQKRTLRTL